MNRSLFLSLLLILFSCVLEAKTSLKEILTDEQFRNFGLEKLSGEELTALSEWIEDQTRMVVDEKRLDLEESFGSELLRLFKQDKPQDKNAPEVKELRRIFSVALGKFNGWSGYTRFPLENGQVWIQTDGDRFIINTVENPEVIIRKGIFGAYFLNFKGWGTRCKVRRIK